MKLIKVLKILVAILLGCTRETKSSGFSLEDDIQNNKNDVENAETNTIALNTKECFCIPTNPQGTHVSDYMRMNGEQDRLVVYLYKNNNNKFVIYIPNREKQIHLPDLTLDEDDKLDTGDTQGVADIIYLYQKMFVPIMSLTPNSQNPYNSPSSNANSPFKLNNVENQDYWFEKDPTNNDYYPGKLLTPTRPGKNNNPNIENKFPTHDRIFFPGADKTFLVPSDTSSSPDTSGNELISGPPNNTPEIPNVSEYLSNLHYVPNTNRLPGNGNLMAYIPQPGGKNDDSVRLPLENGPIDAIRSPLKGDSINLRPDPPENDNNFIFNLPIIFSSNPNLHRPLEQQQKGDKLSFSDGVILPTPDVMEEYKVDLNNADNFNFRPQKDTFFTPYRKNSNKLNMLPANGFELWFQNQIALIQKNRHSKSQAIDKNELRMFILNALNKNGVKVNNDGNLVDTNGNFLDLNNLQLRIILLGDPAEYHKLVATQKCIIAHNLPYLEAVLVTLTYPPKILGIVPLGKTLKQILTETKQLCNNESNRLNKQNCKGLNCNQNKLKVVPDHLNLLIEPKGRPPLKLKPKLNNLLNTYMKDDVKSAATKSGLITEDIPQSIQTLELPDDSEDKVIEDDEDTLDLKIIGGHPALSSGMVVKNKARSAPAYDD